MFDCTASKKNQYPQFAGLKKLCGHGPYESSTLDKRVEKVLN